MDWRELSQHAWGQTVLPNRDLIPLFPHSLRSNKYNLLFSETAFNSHFDFTDCHNYYFRSVKWILGNQSLLFLSCMKSVYFLEESNCPKHLSSKFLKVNVWRKEPVVIPNYYHSQLFIIPHSVPTAEVLKSQASKVFEHMLQYFPVSQPKPEMKALYYLTEISVQILHYTKSPNTGFSFSFHQVNLIDNDYLSWRLRLWDGHGSTCLFYNSLSSHVPAVPTPVTHLGTGLQATSQDMSFLCMASLQHYR